MSTATASLPAETARHRVDSALGMLFFIGSWSMAFGTLFLAFLILRERVGTWPPPGMALPSFPMAAAATLVLLGSSVVLHAAVARARAGRSGVAGLWAAGLALGLGFTALQSWLWFDLLARGSAPGAGIYESLFFGLTWIHAGHVAIALLALLWMQIGILAGRYGPHRLAAVQNVALFWHFMDVVWVVLFLAFFVF